MAGTSTPLGVRSGFHRGRMIQYGLAILTVAVVVGPLVPILWQAFIDKPIYAQGAAFSLRNFVAILTAPAFGEVVRNSLIVAVIATMISQGVGGILALLIGRTDMPMARIWGSVTLWPIFISGLVFAFGWFVAYGPSGYVTLWMKSLFGITAPNLYSVGGMGVILGVSAVPVTVIFCLGALSLADSTLEDAARCCGAGPWRVMTRVTLPLLMPSIAYSGILNFVGALESLSVPLIIGKPVGLNMFMTFIYAEGIERPRPDYGIVAAATVLLLLVIGLLIWLQERLLGNTRRYESVGGKAARRRIFALGPWRWFALALVAAYAIICVLLPMGMVLLRSLVSFMSPLVPLGSLLTLANFEQALGLDASRRALWNTLVISAIGGGIATLFYAVVAVVVQRSEFRFRGVLKYVALLPRAVPGMIAGLGVFYAMLIVPGMAALNGTVIIICLAYIGHYIPTGFGIMVPALTQIGPDLDRAGRTMGASWWQTMQQIIMPLMKPAMVGAYALVFIAFLKEYSTAVFLFGPGTEVLGTAMLRYWVNGDIGPMAALSAVQIVITVLFIALAQGLLRVRLVK